MSLAPTFSRRHLLAATAVGTIGRPIHGRFAALPDWLEFWKDDKYEFHGGTYDPPRDTHPFGDAKDQHGNPFTLETFAGKVIFLYFGYTHCPDACPATLAEWKEAKAAMGDDAKNVVFAMITVDPKRDTPQVVGQYVQFWDAEFLGVSMSEKSTVDVTRAWGIQYSYEQSDSAGGYTVNHDVNTYVVDPKGKLRLTYPLGEQPEDIAEDVKHLLKGE